MKLIKAEWASAYFISNIDHVNLIHEFACYHCLCSTCCRLVLDAHSYELKEESKNSALHWSRVFEWPWGILNGDLQKTMRVLDAGGSHAPFQYVLSRFCGQVVNVDLDEKSFEAVEKMKVRLGYSNITTKVGDIRKIDFPDGHFDRVFCMSVLEHIADWKVVLEELARVTANKGILIISLDVRTNQRLKETPIKEFFIDMDDLSYFGVTWPTHEQSMMGNEISHVTKLACVCLKYVKE